MGIHGHVYAHDDVQSYDGGGCGGGVDDDDGGGDDVVNQEVNICIHAHDGVLLGPDGRGDRKDET